MFGTGIPTKLRCLRYGIKKQGAYFVVKRPYGIIYRTKANQLIELIHEELYYRNNRCVDKNKQYC